MVPLLSWKPGCSKSSLITATPYISMASPRCRSLKGSSDRRLGQGSFMSVGILIEEPRISRPSDAWLHADHVESPNSIRTSELISALSYALDLTEGRSMGHSVRS